MTTPQIGDKARSVDAAPRAVVDPADAIRDDLDARILLILWMARKTFVPMLLLGLCAAAGYFIIVRDPAAFSERLEVLNSPGELLAAALSPFTGVVIAIGLRIAVALAALAAAYPLARSNRLDDYPNTNTVNRYWRLWWDRWKLSQSYRALRWTWAVRRHALDRTNAWGTIWHRWDLIMVVVNIVLSILFVVLFAISAAQLPE